MDQGGSEYNSIKSFQIFTVPGLYGSGPSHWQSKWERLYGFSRIEQNDWDHPQFDDWNKRLVRALSCATFDESILIAHSMGCHLVVKSFPFIKKFIKAVFLVAPPDLESNVIPVDISSFKLDRYEALTVPGLFIYSENDPYASATFSEQLGINLNLKTVNLGKQGHINSDSNLGDWDVGYRLLNYLISLNKSS